ncbi:MAG TPA: hypothetical protein VFZ09_01175 [Archangium sp.]|uniref:hypothetical protein n=1 Tax=Archangium sp. TaxID=1872627 RepID=UPI002E35AA43|nr:hypothetical protein [Archangium sp.]HEX5744820.1 hypothetical protein [Archangium sp.]
MSTPRNPGLRADAGLWMLAEQGYTTVAESLGWTASTGFPIPQWREQTDTVRDAVYDAQLAAHVALCLFT